MSIEDTREKLKKKTLVNLKKEAKSIKLKGYYDLNKGDLVDALAKILSKPIPISQEPEAFFKSKKYVKEINYSNDRDTSTDSQKTVMNKAELEKMILKDLKTLCKSMDIKGYSAKNKAAIIDLILKPKVVTTSKNTTKPTSKLSIKSSKISLKKIPKSKKNEIQRQDDKDNSDSELSNNNSNEEYDDDDDASSVTSSNVSEKDDKDIDSLSEKSNSDFEDNLENEFIYKEPSNHNRISDVLTTESYV